MKILLDRDGKPRAENFRAGNPSIMVANPDHDPGDESSPELIPQPYVETRPFIEVPDDFDLSDKAVVNGELVTLSAEELSARDEADLQAYIAPILLQLDFRAATIRNKYRSQEKDATYTNKSAELDRWIIAGRPADGVESDYPYLVREANATGRTLTEMATLVETKRASWIELDSTIESTCLGHKHTISNVAITTNLDDAKATINTLRETALSELEIL